MPEGTSVTTIGDGCHAPGPSWPVWRSHSIVRPGDTATGWEQLTISHDCNPDTERERECEGFISSIEPCERPDVPRYSGAPPE